MTHSIENEQFRVEIKNQGAELSSIKSLVTQREYIWQADPQIWGSSAPVLFPNIGLLRTGSFNHNGNTYSLPKHGFIRNNSEMTLINSSPGRISFSLRHDEKTLKMFPFEFEFKISFLLNSNKLQVFHEILNTGNKTMHFSLGGHPAFNCSWNGEEKLSDYYVEFKEKETASILQLNNEGLLIKDEIPYLKNSKKISLNQDTFKHDALIFRDLHSSEVSLKSKKNKTEVKMNFADFPFLGIWSKPGAPYVCLEPWAGLPDYADSNRKWSEKKGNLELQAGNTYFASYQIQIIESN